MSGRSNTTIHLEVPGYSTQKHQAVENSTAQKRLEIFWIGKDVLEIQNLAEYQCGTRT